MAQQMNHLRIFLVEDDPFYAKLLTHHLALNPSYELHTFSKGKACLEALNLKPDVICLDLSLPDYKGDVLCNDIQKQAPNTPIIFISSNEDIKKALDLIKKEEVYDYIVKDQDTTDRLWKSLINLSKNRALKEKVEVLSAEVKEKYDYQNTIIGNSPAIKDVFRLMDKAVKTNINVSISGETGSGKELVAKCIHYNSGFQKGKFIAVNIAAIAENLIESELFGHEKGAFTGAHQRHIGKFEQAQNGTIFLDEIAELPASAQVLLLRVLQEREITRVGGTSPIKINTRLIVATHKDLSELVENGSFREDLYYRIMGLPIHNPPLRERKTDLFLLADHFIEHFAKENKLKAKHLGEDAKKKLLSHPFAGNIRELKSVIELAHVMSEGDQISASDIIFKSANTLDGLLKTQMSLKAYNAQIIRHYLDKYPRDISKVADILDVGKSTLYRMIQNKEV